MARAFFVRPQPQAKAAAMPTYVPSAEERALDASRNLDALLAKPLPVSGEKPMPRATSLIDRVRQIRQDGDAKVAAKLDGAEARVIAVIEDAARTKEEAAERLAQKLESDAAEAVAEARDFVDEVNQITNR